MDKTNLTRQNERIVYNAYCDESCHLEHDHIPIMGFGIVSIQADAIRTVSREIRDLKLRARCVGELKWTKVSPKNVGFYCDLVDYFFSQKALSFRALIVHDKDKLDHECFNDGSHDLFYYKMYYYLVKNVAEYDPGKEWRIYIDIKDKNSSARGSKLAEVLRSKFHDPEGRLIGRIQQIRSNESQIIQLTDFLLGAVVYSSRKANTSIAKLAVIKRIREQSRLSLRVTTVPWEQKFNLFHFWPRRG